MSKKTRQRKKEPGRGYLQSKSKKRGNVEGSASLNLRGQEKGWEVEEGGQY